MTPVLYDGQTTTPTRLFLILRTKELFKRVSLSFLLFQHPQDGLDLGTSCDCKPCDTLSEVVNSSGNGGEVQPRETHSCPSSPTETDCSSGFSTLRRRSVTLTEKVRHSTVFVVVSWKLKWARWKASESYKNPTKIKLNLNFNPRGNNLMIGLEGDVYFLFNAKMLQ